LKEVQAVDLSPACGASTRQAELIAWGALGGKTHVSLTNEWKGVN